MTRKDSLSRDTSPKRPLLQLRQAGTVNNLTVDGLGLGKMRRAAGGLIIEPWPDPELTFPGYGRLLSTARTFS